MPQDALLETLGPLFPASPEVDELLRLLLVDWRREAGQDEDTPVVLEILERDLREELDSRSMPERMMFLRATVLERHIRELGRQSLKAGEGLKAGTLQDGAAKAEGERLLGELKRMREHAKAISAAESGVIQREIQDLELEALYLIERKASSKRYQHLFSP